MLWPPSDFLIRRCRSRALAQIRSSPRSLASFFPPPLLAEGMSLRPAVSFQSSGTGFPIRSSLPDEVRPRGTAYKIRFPLFSGHGCGFLSAGQRLDFRTPPQPFPFFLTASAPDFPRSPACFWVPLPRCPFVSPNTPQLAN